MADYSDSAFEAATDAIEAAYGDLAGIEAASTYLTDWYLAIQTGEEEGGGAHHVDWTVPAAESFTVYPLIPSLDAEDDDIRGRLDASFEAGKQSAVSTGSWLRAMVQFLYGVDAEAIKQAARDSQTALSSVKGRFDGDWGEMEVLVDDYWRGGSSDEFRNWYGSVNTAINNLVYFAGIAAVGAGGAGDAIATSQKLMLQAATSAQSRFESTLGTWRDESGSFPLRPGIADQAMREVGEILGGIEEYGSLIPGVGKYVDAAAEVGKVLGVGFDLLTDDLPETLTVPPLSGELFTGIKDALEKIASETVEAHDKLGHKTRAALAEFRDRDYLVALDRLPDADAPGWNYTH